ncbi:DUF1028 domain-containing protein [Stappia sp.]|uniref:DUF1028 domain-containing protein n=1 Tax=Stappia sp. TaxID=1870903 RepID=UPI003A98E590
MTYSIVARDPATGHFGIAVASRFFAVGAVVPYMAGGVGAIASQAFISPLYGVDGMKMLQAGASAEDVVAAMTARDAGSHSRQLHVMDAAGRSAAFTGEKCIGWAGHLVAEGVSVAGNMLAGPEVLEATLAAYQAHPVADFARRLLLAMDAGEAAGGDKRGRQSAALRIVRGEAYPWIDIRADDHPDPLAELRRLLAVAGERYLHVAETLPTSDNVSGMLDRAVIDLKIAELEAEREREGRASASFATPPA